MKDQEYQKKIEQAEYRAKLLEAELGAIRSSKAYKLSKGLGIAKSRISSDPVGLSKKVARTLLTDPKKFGHLLRSTNRGAFMAQSVVDQTAKYQEWILINEPDEDELNEQRAASDAFTFKPLISVITPVFNPPVDVLEELIESVLEQTYPNFELCLGNFGDDGSVRALLRKYAQLDGRIKTWDFAENKGIAFNSNQILAKVTGEYIGLLDHDDTLSPDALYENVKLLNEKPYDFIYSDKDKIDEGGNRFDPLFKPGLSPEMLLNINYLTHFNVMRTALVKDVGAWDSETDGAQDWDLFLKVVAESRYVGFIPKVLYHWRVIASSTAMSIETKPYALAGQRKAVDKYLSQKGIPATAYHRGTELFLKWDKNDLDGNPLVFVFFSNLSNLGHITRYVRKVSANPTFVVLVEEDHKDKQAQIKGAGYEVLTYRHATLAQTLSVYAKTSSEKKEGTVLFMLDEIRFSKNSAASWYEDLTGWLSIPEVAAVSGRLVNKQDLIVDSGGVITKELEYAPLFKGLPRFYQSYIGNAEWVRNLHAISANFSATRLSDLREFTMVKSETTTMDAYFVWLSQTKRLVMTPHATAIYPRNGDVDPRRGLSFMSKFVKQKTYADSFSNPNMSTKYPLRLFDDERLIGQPNQNGSDLTMPIDRYQHDATILAGSFDISEVELKNNYEIIKASQNDTSVKSVAWFLPSFDSVYAGLMNIFSFAAYLADKKKLATTIYILKADSDVTAEKELVLKALPQLAAASFVAIKPQDIDSIKSHDAGIATQWATAFPLAKATNIGKKYYFIQDNEANFYPKGTISALVELSYRFGFTAIAGTEGLLQMYREKYEGEGVVLKSKIDLSAYHPRKDLYYQPQKPYKVFFYARPNMPRNAFELGIAGLKKLKEALGDEVEIITAGAAWNAAEYGVEGMFTNLGKIAYEAVPRLYRSVDAGLMFMFSGHPGVTASELMASGCPVVVNEYDDVAWHELYQDKKTCLVTVATASEVARNLKRCLTDTKLRQALIDGGLEKTANFYSGYEDSQEDVARLILGLA